MNDVLKLAKAVRKINTIFSTFKDSIYTKNEADNKFINQELMENGLYVIKNKNIKNMNDAIQPGGYSISATGVENKPLPNSGSLFVNKDPGGIRQFFQTERTIFIRQFGGIPPSWTDWKELGLQGPKGDTGPIGPQGPKGDTPDISNLVTKTQYTNDLNKKIDKTAFNAIGQHISFNGITIHIQKSNTVVTCNVEGIFKKGKANGWHEVSTRAETSYRPVNMIIKVPLTINIGNTIQINKYAALQIETSGRIMIRVYGLQNDDVEFGGSATWIR